MITEALPICPKSCSQILSLKVSVKRVSGEHQDNTIKTITIIKMTPRMKTTAKMKTTPKVNMTQNEDSPKNDNNQKERLPKILTGPKKLRQP